MLDVFVPRFKADIPRFAMPRLNYNLLETRPPAGESPKGCS